MVNTEKKIHQGKNGKWHSPFRFVAGWGGGEWIREAIKMNKA
jgi:hypothetical protein